MKKKKIAFDCDGVLANFAGYMLDAINRKLGTHYRIEDWTEYYVGKVFGPEAEQIIREEMSIPETWGRFDPYHGVITDLKLISEVYDIYVVSSVPPHGEEYRRHWLQNYGFPIKEFIRVDHARDKVKVMKELDIPVFVDDDPEVAHWVTRNNRLCILVNRPWNRNERVYCMRGYWPAVAHCIAVLGGGVYL